MPPFDLRTAIPLGLNDEHPGEPCWEVDAEVRPNVWETVEVSEEIHRFVEEFDAAEERQLAAEAEVEKRRNPPPPPPPEEVPASGKLEPRQEEFCRHYAARPVATRAAVLAGYAEENAAGQGHRLLKNPLVLERIAQLRAERNLRYVIDADTLHDKLEAVFFEALAERNHAAAVAALRLQAGLGRLPTRMPAVREADIAGDEPGPAAPLRKRRPKADKSRVRRRQKPRKAYKSR